ncbi:tail fiber protein [Gallaecimonas sp. GXIMD4217]|uniref:phage tail protein n=1 Tax=Gallaecimonas sp. GXIMD4217 TaxID=3131927 RepID=UPI00311B4371
MAEPYIGEIKMVGFNFAPRGYALCDGQLLPIASNTALFSLLGTTYGGDGRTTFALPDLRGRVPVHPGDGPGRRRWRWGEREGSETNTLSLNQLPIHNHGLQGASATITATTTISPPASSENGNSDSPEGKVPATVLSGGRAATAYADAGNTTMQSFMASTNGTAALSGQTGTAGASQSVNNIQPSLAMYFVIALQGIFPSRS